MFQITAVSKYKDGGVAFYSDFSTSLSPLALPWRCSCKHLASSYLSRSYYVASISCKETVIALTIFLDWLLPKLHWLSESVLNCLRHSLPPSHWTGISWDIHHQWFRGNFYISHCLDWNILLCKIYIVHSFLGTHDKWLPYERFFHPLSTIPGVNKRKMEVYQKLCKCYFRQPDQTYSELWNSIYGNLYSSVACATW